MSFLTNFRGFLVQTADPCSKISEKAEKCYQKVNYSKFLAVLGKIVANLHKLLLIKSNSCFHGEEEGQKLLMETSLIQFLAILGKFQWIFSTNRSILALESSEKDKKCPRVLIWFLFSPLLANVSRFSVQKTDPRSRGIKKDIKCNLRLILPHCPGEKFP